MATRLRNLPKALTPESIPLNRVTVGRILVPILFLVAWSGLTALVGRGTLPSPLDVASTLGSGVENGWLVPNTIDTLTALFYGFLLASITGLTVSTILGLRAFTHDVMFPFVLNIYAIPKIVLFPLFLMVFGIGINLKIMFGAFHGFFPLVIIVTSAIRGIPDHYIEFARSHRLGGFKQFRHIVLPYVLPDVVIGLRFAFNLTFLGIIISGLFGSSTGLGLLLQNAMGIYDVQRIMAIVMLLFLIALVVNATFFAIQNSLERRWNLASSTTAPE